MIDFIRKGKCLRDQRKLESTSIFIITGSKRKIIFVDKGGLLVNNRRQENMKINQTNYDETYFAFFLSGGWAWVGQASESFIKLENLFLAFVLRQHVRKKSTFSSLLSALCVAFSGFTQQISIPKH